jgi:hypothetical protein
VKLTSQEIMALPAGRELDALVAVKVMGWTWPACKARFPEISEWSIVGTEGDAVAPEPGWSPSMCRDAMEVVDTWHGDCELRRQNGQWKVTFFEPSREYMAWAETLPLAICRARLLAAEASAVDAMTR